MRNPAILGLKNIFFPVRVIPIILGQHSMCQPIQLFYDYSFSTSFVNLFNYWSTYPIIRF
jgi:hypothetical protein